jgi:hypothetical protein
MGSRSIPSGMQIKIVCIGVRSDNQLCAYYQTATITGNMTIEVTMNETTDADLTTLLNSL